MRRFSTIALKSFIINILHKDKNNKIILLKGQKIVMFIELTNSIIRT